MSENQTSQEAMKILADNIYKAIQKEIAKAPFDITKKAVVTADLGNDTYQVKMEDSLYKIPSKINNLKIGETVDILIPRNNLEHMYIVSSQVTENSGYGPEGVIASLSGVRWADFK